MYAGPGEDGGGGGVVGWQGDGGSSFDSSIICGVAKAKEISMLALPSPYPAHPNFGPAAKSEPLCPT